MKVSLKAKYLEKKCQFKKNTLKEAETNSKAFFFFNHIRTFVIRLMYLYVHI